jgi:hypothetical protein
VSTPAAAIKGAEAAQDAARDWQAVRADATIQYAPMPLPKPPETPGWLKAFGEFLESVFGPVGQAIGLSWPVMQWVLAGIGVLAVAYTLWRLTEPWRERVKTAKAEAEPAWIPDREAALALLDDADRLAGEGRFDEATHLLLRRSVSQIADARPDWVHPASTAREIAALAALPDRARAAFALIAARVERSLFALRSLDAADWQAARGAYADFALERMPTVGSAG